MPADVDDGATSSNGSAEVAANEFNAAAWSPADREYGIIHLLMCRTSLPEETSKPSEVEHLKFVDSRSCSFAPPTSQWGCYSSDEEEGVSEGEPYEETEPASWPGKPGFWWRVNGSLGENVIVRAGVSLSSPESRRVSPGELVQQAGLARALAGGRARGCIRLPIRPSGWVTADASRAGGPKYLVRASIPRWRVVYTSNNGKDSGDIIVREDSALGSDEVAVLHCGDLVEQAGPSYTRPDGIVRMPVTTAVVRRSDMPEGESALPPPSDGNGRPSSTLGWVTVDATAAGGPLFFKPAADVDGTKRRRRPKVP